MRYGCIAHVDLPLYPHLHALLLRRKQLETQLEMQNTPVWQIYEMAEMEYVRNGVCLHNLKVPIPVGRFPIARPVIAHLSDGRERDMRFHDMRWNSPVPPAIWISMCDRASFFYCGNPFSPRRARHLRSPSQLAIWPPPRFSGQRLGGILFNKWGEVWIAMRKTLQLLWHVDDPECSPSIIFRLAHFIVPLHCAFPSCVVLLRKVFIPFAEWPAYDLS